ncbi:MAG: SMC family ATPase [bacterium]
MIPLSLTLKGIYSYRTEQTIDFTKLTNNHLFGIFGPVGSGKSTILEAISYALFGETERLNSRDGRNYNMMNLKSRELFIDFKFKSGNKNQEIFRFTVKGTRDKKDFNIVKTLDRKGYKLQGESWIPLDCTTAEEIIGLSYLNFRRTIIIPQGQFQEFLQLGETDRTRMMKEIFNLNRYDLASKTDVIDKSTCSALDGVKGQLHQIGEIDEGLIEQESTHRNELVVGRGKLEGDLSVSEKIDKSMQDMKKLLDKVGEARRALDLLNQQSDNYRNRELLVERYELCQKNFPDILKQRNDAEAQISEALNRINENRKTITTLGKKIEQAELEFEQTRKEYEHRHDSEIMWKELESVGEVLTLDHQAQSLELQQGKLEKNIKAKTEKAAKLRIETKEMEATLKKSKKEMPNEKKLLEIKSWSDKYYSIKEAIDGLQILRDEHSENLKTLEMEKETLLADSKVLAYTTSADRKNSLGKLIETLKTIAKGCRLAAASKQNDIDTLRQTEVLESFAANLNEGDPCPLCGSEHHPHKYVGKGIKTQIDLLKKEKRKLEKDAEGLDEKTQEFVRLNSELENANKAFEKTLKDLEVKNASLTEQEGKYCWPDYSRDNIDKIDNELAHAESINSDLADLEENIEQSRTTIEEINTTISEAKDALQKVKEKSSELSGERKTLVQKIEHFKEESFNEWAPQSIKSEIEKLKGYVKDIEIRYQELDDSIRKMKERRSELSGVIDTEETNQATLQEKLKGINNDLTERMHSTGFDNLAAIQNILTNKIDTKKEKEAIRSFNEKVITSKEHLDKLEQEASESLYDRPKHLELQTKIDEIKESIRQVNQDIGRLESHIAELTKNLEKKHKLENEKDKLELKASDLAILKRLFRGGGFVNYASRIYLQNLCGVANQRYAQLTRQKLRLELRDDNSFQIRDFLNDGKTRSVKTLSGGQTFQASLSLALALADNIQQVAKTEENFFFLDEGFGTLDKESLTTVFEALKSLRKENRVVGVISHVEELQQEIDNYIKVKLDSEQGSIVSVS